MSRTREQVLSDFSKFIDDSWESASTAAGNTVATTLEDSALAPLAAETAEGGYVRVTNAGAAQYESRRVVFLGSAGVATMDPAFSTTILSGWTYQFHNYDPAKKLVALDRGRLLAYPQLSVTVMDETVTGDGVSTEVNVPSTLVRGPVEVWQEQPLDLTSSQNMLSALTPKQDALTNWAATTLTAALYAKVDHDRLIPRLSHGNATLLTGTIGTYAVALSAAEAAAASGRKVVFGNWVFWRGSGSRVRVYITDATDTTYSSTYHTGSGWELMTVTKTIADGNTTTLKVGVDVATGAATSVRVNGAWFAYGDRVPQTYPIALTRRSVWRDDTTQRVMLDSAPDRGHNLRMIGRNPLSAVSAAAGDTIEVTEHTQELLFAKAARVLFAGLGFSLDQMQAMSAKISEVESRFAEMSEDYKTAMPANYHWDVN